jgi:hypothetical protein
MSKTPLHHLLGGLGEIAQSGLFRAAVKNWWASIPVGLVVWHSVQKRRKAGNLSALGVVGDITPIVMLVGTLVVLNHTLEEREKAKPAATKPSIIPTGAPVTDADFTPAPSLPHPVVQATEMPSVPAAAPTPASPVQESDYG